MIRQLLTYCAKRWLGLEEPGNKLALIRANETSLANLTDANSQLAQENDRLLSEIRHKDALIKINERTMKRITEKYPTVWLDGDVAQGVVQLPKLKMACEFFREENKLCVAIPFEKAQGHKPTEFIPPFLEKDPDLQVEGGPDRMNGKVWVYKIPILGWNDALELTRNIQDGQPNYELDGSIKEKVRTFRCPAGVNGTFRRERIGGQTIINLWFTESDLPNPSFAISDIHRYLPAGTLRYVPPATIERHAYGLSPNRIWHWRVPVEEVEAKDIDDGLIKKLPPKQ